MSESTNGSVSVRPHDTYERARVGNRRRPGWRNQKPAPRYDLIIIGGGPAGSVAANVAAAAGVRVALIERSLLGGVSLNSGCIPSKTLIRTSRLYAEMRDAAIFGAQPPADIRVD